MRRMMTTGVELIRRNPKSRLGSAMVQALDIMDGMRKMQIVVFQYGEARLLDIRICGRTGMTATDMATGKTTRIPARAIWAIERAGK